MRIWTNLFSSFLRPRNTSLLFFPLGILQTPLLFSPMRALAGCSILRKEKQVFAILFLLREDWPCCYRVPRSFPPISRSSLWARRSGTLWLSRKLLSLVLFPSLFFVFRVQAALRRCGGNSPVLLFELFIIFLSSFCRRPRPAFPFPPWAAEKSVDFSF